MIIFFNFNFYHYFFLFPPQIRVSGVNERGRWGKGEREEKKKHMEYFIDVIIIL